MAAANRPIHSKRWCLMITDRKEPERSKNEPNDVRDSTYNDIRHQIQQLTMAQDIQMPMIVMSTYQLK